MPSTLPLDTLWQAAAMSDGASGTPSAAGTAAPAARTFTPKVWAWALWDWGSAAFNAVITTFVFSVYLLGTTSEAGVDGATETVYRFGSNVSLWHTIGLVVTGVLIAAFAPIMGQRSDRAGRRTMWLGINTAMVTLCIFGLFFVQPDQSFLLLGLLLLAAGNVFFEFASVNYYAMLNGLSTPATVGRISGFGWGLGYLGGIVLLLILYVGFIAPDVGWFGVTSEDGMQVRVSMLVCGIWTILFSLPVLFAIRDKRGRSASGEPAPERAKRESIWTSYRILFRTVATLWRDDRNTLRFLIASAVFRDGMAAVFVYGALIGTTVYGISESDVLVFGIVANVVAGIATIAAGWLDDAWGPKRVIVICLTAMIVGGSALFFLHEQGSWVFWSFGLVLCVFVGPVQSASRTFLSRLIPAGREGQMFGLYATTGRAASFLGPAMVAIFLLIGAALAGVTDTNLVYHWAVLGVLTVLLAGLLLILPVKTGVRQDSALVTEHTAA